MKKSLENFFTAISASKQFIAAYSLLFLFYIVILPKDGHGWDTACWKEWSKHLFTNGLGNAYKTWTDYMPLYQYFLWIYGLMQHSLEKIESNIYLLKIFTLSFDFIGGFFLVKLIKERISNAYEWFFYSMFFFLNIAIFYNSLIWGQVDGILSTLIFISVFFAIKRRVLASILFFILAVNMKLQAIIYMPIIGLGLLPPIVENFTWKNLGKWIAPIVILQTLIVLPFAINGDLHSIFAVIKNSAGKYPVLSMNAYNIWEWFFKGDLMKIPDSGLFLGITYKLWGLLLFFASSFIALWPMLKTTFNRVFKKSTEQVPPSKILLVSALIPLLFFFFNTQMHERYSHPALIFVIAYSILNKDFLPSLLVCTAYLLNMEDVLHYLQLHIYNWIFFKAYFIAIIYFVGILLLFFRLFDLNFFARLKPFSGRE